MAEQYEVAAWRHLGVGEKLLAQQEIDDAGYHFGVSGENSLKAMLQLAGLEAHWLAAGIRLNRTAMRAHFPNIQSLTKLGWTSNSMGEADWRGRLLPWCRPKVSQPCLRTGI